jgi:CxxC-x17-CxxC domain-containing protein
MYPATCSKCGQETEVPFQPTNGKPVYCSDCFRIVRGN